jgi:hypothetical protein
MNKLHAHSFLLDPRTCGEDLPAMASRMSELAPMLCRDCADYHLRFAITRCVSPFDKSVAVDRALLIRRIQDILAGPAQSSSASVNILIAGAADTGVLATCAHATAALGERLLLRCRFIVFDRCRSPLALCAEFAARHGLRLRTVEADLTTVNEDFAADLIVCHSFLRFLDRPGQIDLLKKFDDWLRPEGAIVVSQSIRPKGKSHLGKEVRRLNSNLALAKAAVADGRITLAPDAMPVFERLFASNHDHLTRSGDIASTGDLRDLLLEAGLRERSIDVVEHDFPPVDQQKLTRVRAVAVCGSSRDV